MFGLTHKAVTALGVVAVSLVLLLCLMSYGTAEYADPAVAANWKIGLARSFVDVCGAGAYVLALLPLVWGVIVYFQERTPDLVLRGVGTVALACSTSMIAGLANSGEPGVWTGDLGAATSSLVSGLSSSVGTPVAAGVGWMLSCALFLVSLIVATDWLFHTVRRGIANGELDGGVAVLTEPESPLLDDDEESEPRGFVSSHSAAARAAAEIEVQDAAAVAERFEELTEGWATQDLGDRTVLRSPSGYKGVDFEDPNVELADAHEQAVSYVDHDAMFAGHVELDDSPSLGAATGEIDDALAWLDDSDEQFVAEPVGGEPETSVDEADEGDLEFESGDYTGAAEVREPAEESFPEPAVDDGLLSVSAALPAVILDDDETVEAPPAPVPTTDVEPGALDAVDVADPMPATPWATETSLDPQLAEDITLDPIVVDAVAEPVDEDDDLGPDDATVEAVPSLEAVLDSHAGEIEPEDEVAGGDNALLEVASAIRAETDDRHEVELPLFRAVGTEAATAPESAPEPQAETEDDPESIFPVPDLEAVEQLDLDPLFRPAVDAALGRGRASVVVLQRRLGIGHGRALRLLDQMTAAGVVGDETASGARPILVRRAEWDAFAAEHLPDEL